MTFANCGAAFAVNISPATGLAPISSFLGPGVAEYFLDEQSVNSALRTLIRMAKRPVRRSR